MEKTPQRIPHPDPGGENRRHDDIVLVSKPPTIKIATRTSKLALWQAETVKQRLEMSGHNCELVLIESTGDLHLTQPIYAMGISGVFTKQLDIALLDGSADIAVHSLKDVPTQMARGLMLAATLERGSYQDVMIAKDNNLFDPNGEPAVIATSSLRRRAQWLAKYPEHSTAPIRGNVQTRLRKFAESNSMKGVIFAKAGLERLDLLPAGAVVLDWMIPAPAQGIVGIVCREDDRETLAKCATINHQDSFVAGQIERQFLRTLMGGCSVPISALAVKEGDHYKFKGAMHSFDGTRAFIVDKEFSSYSFEDAGKVAADELLSQTGAKELLEEIKNKKWDAEGTVD